MASGRRYVISENGEGMEVPFTHAFEMDGRRIKTLRIRVGDPQKSEIAPSGSLEIEDMGRLAAMAWMVA